MNDLADRDRRQDVNEDDDEVRGLLRTKRTARFWWPPIQLQVWHMDGMWVFLVSWHGKRVYFSHTLEVMPR